ncbi:MAG: c-type cytochrome [Proteobacteria bacterium]|nr:c-type cytochrome [Pseudomonadota bacterium]
MRLALALLPMVSPALANPPGSAAEREFAAVLQLQADAVHGEQLFDTCSGCHSGNGSGVSDGTVPAIAGQHFRVVVWQLVSFRHGQRLDSRMQHFTDKLHLNGGTQDIADVAAYVSHLPPAASVSNIIGNDTVHGANLYKGNCSSCHGASAEGDDQKRNPRLAGQHYEYLLHRWQDGI